MNKRSLNLFGVIGSSFGEDSVTAAAFKAQLETVKPDEELEICVHSPGGDLLEGLAISNMIREVAKGRPVTMNVIGLAASMGSVIAASGTKLVMAPSAFFMVHNPWSIAAGDAEQIRQEAARLDLFKKELCSVYGRVFKKTPEEIAALMDAETWISSSEAAAYGLQCEVAEGMPAAALIKSELAFGKMPEAVKGFYESVKPAPVVPAAPAAASSAPPASVEPVGQPAGADDGAKSADPVPVVPPAPVPAVASVVPVPAPAPLTPPPSPEPAPEFVALTQRLEAVTHSAREWQGKHDRVAAELVKTQAKLAEVTKDFEAQVAAKESERKAIADRLAQVSLHVFTLTPEIGSWEDAVKQCKGDSAEARRRFPVLYDSWMASMRLKNGGK